MASVKQEDKLPGAFPEGFRRVTTGVVIGTSSHRPGVGIGSDYPVMIQSMTDTPTNDVERSATQVIELARAGAAMVRLTAQGVAQAASIGRIREVVEARGYDIPLSADIHFNPAAAFAAAETADKVRINPGNFVDPGRTFRTIDYDDLTYGAELKRLEDKFVPFIELCRQHHVAIRIGVNHGSLSDRIMSRYGDTPEGIVESAMEFLRVCRRCDFDQVVVSVKASNVAVMVTSVRLLVKAMEAEGMSFPLHLGVTEAGDGDMGRIKSAIGIGSLLVDGIGDTIRVSLTEEPVKEIPAASMLLRHIEKSSSGFDRATDDKRWLRPYDVGLKGAAEGAMPLVLGHDLEVAYLPEEAVIVEGDIFTMRRKLRELSDAASRAFVVLKKTCDAGMSRDEIVTAAAVDLGSLALEGYGSALWLEAPSLEVEDRNKICLDILQACRRRISATEYIACPGCGRTLFNLHDTLLKVKEATSGYPGLKIAVMGCVVNGPGEMADADYGYVGAGVGKVSVYKGKQCIHRNVDPDEALMLLLELIRSGNEKNN